MCMMNNPHFGFLLQGLLHNVLPNAEAAAGSSWEPSVAALESQYLQAAARSDLGWEGSINLSANPSGDGISDVTKASDFVMQSVWPTQPHVLRQHSQLLQQRPPSLFAHESSASSLHNPAATATALRGYGSISVAEALQNSHVQYTAHAESYFPGSCISAARHDMKNLDNRRRRYLGFLDLEQQTPAEEILEDDYGGVCGLHGDGAAEYGRIGLNLGRRTYFCAGDLMMQRLGNRLTHDDVRGRVAATMQHRPICQADGCTADLSKAKHYYRRHKVCEMHSKAAHVLANAQTQRFCQQCSRLHIVSEFDDTKRSCRKRLADHNRRRRKTSTTAAAPQTTDITAVSKPEESDQSLETYALNKPEAKPPADVLPSKEKESSSDLEEQGCNNAMMAHSLDYDTLSSSAFFPRDCSSNTQLQLNKANPFPPDSQLPPSLSPTTDASLMLSNNNLQLPTPEMIYRKNDSSFEAQHEMLYLPSQSLRFHEPKSATKRLTTAASSNGDLERSFIDFQQIIPAQHSHDHQLHAHHADIIYTEM